MMPFHLWKKLRYSSEEAMNDFKDYRMASLASGTVKAPTKSRARFRLFVSRTTPWPGSHSPCKVSEENPAHLPSTCYL